MREGGERVAGRRRNAILCALPWGYCVAMTFRYGYDAPYWDEWWKIPLIEKAFEGTLRLSDMWSLINEHRVFFPNLITVPLARLTHWNLYAELAVTLVFGTLTFALLVAILLRAERALELRGSLWALPMAAVLLFSFSHHAVWVWGLHVMIAMTTFFLVAIVWLLGSPAPGARRLVLAGVAGVLASYSFGAGIVAWPVGLVMLVSSRAWSTRRRGAVAVLWSGAAVLTMVVYFAGYTSTPASRSALDVLAHPLRYLAYVLSYIGAPLFSFSPELAVGAGLIGGGFAVFLLTRVLQGSEALRIAARPYAGIMAIGWCVAGLTGLKQSHEGIAQALSSRYSIWPSLFWIGLLALVYLYKLHTAPEGPSRERNALTAVSLAILLLSTASSAYGTYRADERHDAFLLGRQALLEGRADEDLLYLYPDLDVPTSMRETLLRYKLSIFREE